MTVDTKVIERVITISAKPETVFRLLTDGGEYVRWKGESAQLDARPNGVFRVIFANRTDVVSGRFVEVIPGRRVVFTWGWENNPLVPPGASTVEIDLEPAGTGRTQQHAGNEYFQQQVSAGPHPAVRGRIVGVSHVRHVSFTDQRCGNCRRLSSQDAFKSDAGAPLSNTSFSALCRGQE